MKKLIPSELEDLVGHTTMDMLAFAAVTGKDLKRNLLREVREMLFAVSRNTSDESRHTITMDAAQIATLFSVFCVGEQIIGTTNFKGDAS